MILAFDTYYFDDKAKTVAVAFENWTATEPTAIYTEILEGVEAYVPGSFYKRELPCIASLFKQISLDHVEAVIIDGFVFLDDEQTPGLGGYVYEHLNKSIPVIGVAKTNFATIHRLKREVLRGDSRKPLYVTAQGLDIDVAAQYIQQMSGPYRLPALLKKLDALTKE